MVEKKLTVAEGAGENNSIAVPFNTKTNPEMLSLNEAFPDFAKVIPDIAPKLIDHDIGKGLNVVDRILKSTDEEFGNRRFLLDCFNEYGLPLVMPAFFKPWSRYMNTSGFGALQVPSEAVDFLRLVAKLDVRTGVEVGTYRGGLSYFMTAVLQRAQPDFVLTLIDPWDSLVAFDLFSKKLNLDKKIPGTSDDLYGQVFDLVFIDGDHTYNGAMRDFMNLGRHARKVVGFHDIHDHSADSGTVAAWNTMKSSLVETHTIYEIAHSVDRGLGIGAAVRA